MLPLHPLSSPFLLRTADNATASTAGDSLSSVDNDSMKCPSQPQSQFEALKVFKKQFQMGVSEIDEVAIALALKACKGDLTVGSQLHSLTIRSAFFSYITVLNSLMNMYCKSGQLICGYHCTLIFFFRILCA
nr:pentatricopeptide repeat-containing protein At4g32430, mitochondrial [Ipomoea batatas]